MCNMALILSGLALIPFTNTRQRRILPFCTPNTYFSRFNFNYVLCMLVKVSAKSFICVSFVLLVITMLSMYAKAFLCIQSLRMAFVIL
jgi:hypothetical protein